jgi:hypothetical protein
MQQKESHSHRVPGVDTKELNERILLEARLLGLDAQVRNFGRVRDRLAAVGKDGAAYYKTIQARRDEVTKALRKSAPGAVLPSGNPGGLSGPFVHRADQALLSMPIAPAKFDRHLGVFGFGTSGFVQLGAASEGISDVIGGEHPISGSIESVPGAFPGVVNYTGVLEVGPESIDPDDYDPTIDYFWVRNWKYLVPFPPPTTESRLTYRFDVGSFASVFFEGGEAMLMNFVSVGETGNLTTGNDVVANASAGWPLMADLTQPAPGYNGRYGAVDGLVSVQRSFMVTAGHVPAVAIVVGVIASLSMMTRLRLIFSQYSSIGVGLGDMTRVSYSYEPQLVLSQG